MNNSHIGATVGSFLNISGNGIEIFILNVFLFIWALSVNVNEVIKSSERTPWKPIILSGQFHKNSFRRAKPSQITRPVRKQYNFWRLKHRRKIPWDTFTKSELGEWIGDGTSALTLKVKQKSQWNRQTKLMSEDSAFQMSAVCGHSCVPGPRPKNLQLYWDPVIGQLKQLTK